MVANTVFFQLIRIDFVSFRTIKMFQMPKTGNSKEFGAVVLQKSTFQSLFLIRLALVCFLKFCFILPCSSLLSQEVAMSFVRVTLKSYLSVLKCSRVHSVLMLFLREIKFSLLQGCTLNFIIDFLKKSNFLICCYRRNVTWITCEKAFDGCFYFPLEKGLLVLFQVVCYVRILEWWVRCSVWELIFGEKS